MFNLFKKQQSYPENQLANNFKSLTLNQRMSIVNLLLCSGPCDESKGDIDKKMNYLNSFIASLDLHCQQSMTYLET